MNLAFPPLNHFTNLHTLSLQNVPFPYVEQGTTSPVKHIHITNHFHIEQLDWVAILGGALDLCSLRLECRYATTVQPQNLPLLLANTPISGHLTSLSIFSQTGYRGLLLSHFLEIFSSSLTHLGVEYPMFGGRPPIHDELGIWEKVFFSQSFMLMLLLYSQFLTDETLSTVGAYPL
jgi:hypothetical protein